MPNLRINIQNSHQNSGKQNSMHQQKLQQQQQPNHSQYQYQYQYQYQQEDGSYSPIQPHMQSYSTQQTQSRPQSRAETIAARHYEVEPQSKSLAATLKGPLKLQNPDQTINTSSLQSTISQLSELSSLLSTARHLTLAAHHHSLSLPTTPIENRPKTQSVVHNLQDEVLSISSTLKSCLESPKYNLTDQQKYEIETVIRLLDTCYDSSDIETGNSSFEHPNITERDQVDLVRRERNITYEHPTFSSHPRNHRSQCFGSTPQGQATEPYIRPRSSADTASRNQHQFANQQYSQSNTNDFRSATLPNPLTISRNPFFVSPSPTVPFQPSSTFSHNDAYRISNHQEQTHPSLNNTWSTDAYDEYSNEASSYNYNQPPTYYFSNQPLHQRRPSFNVRLNRSTKLRENYMQESQKVRLEKKSQIQEFYDELFSTTQFFDRQAFWEQRRQMHLNQIRGQYDVMRRQLKPSPKPRTQPQNLSHPAQSTTRIYKDGNNNNNNYNSNTSDNHNYNYYNVEAEADNARREPEELAEYGQRLQQRASRGFNNINNNNYERPIEDEDEFPAKRRESNFVQQPHHAPVQHVHYEHPQRKTINTNEARSIIDQTRIVTPENTAIAKAVETLTKREWKMIIQSLNTKYQQSSESSDGSEDGVETRKSTTEHRLLALLNSNPTEEKNLSRDSAVAASQRPKVNFLKREQPVPIVKSVENTARQNGIRETGQAQNENSVLSLKDLEDLDLESIADESVLDEEEYRLRDQFY